MNTGASDPDPHEFLTLLDPDPVPVAIKWTKIKDFFHLHKLRHTTSKILLYLLYYSGRGKFMPLPLKSKILETPGFLVTDYIKMFPL